ncbi:MAG: helix-turn-helix transcriptional regulator, partial [Chloroflexia bacterium]
MSATTFGLWLKERRGVLGLTQEQLGERIGCSPDSVRKFEAGTRRPSRQIADLLAGCFNVPPDEVELFARFARGMSD